MNSDSSNKTAGQNSADIKQQNSGQNRSESGADPSIQQDTQSGENEAGGKKAGNEKDIRVFERYQ